jgi:hypothetical protein
MLVDHLDLDSSNWKIKQLVYNGQGPFSNASDLQAAFDCGFICADCLPVRQCSVCSPAHANAAGCRLLSKISIQAPKASTPEKPLFSSMRRRGPIRYLDERPVPPIAPPPAGERFAVKGNQASCCSSSSFCPPCLARPVMPSLAVAKVHWLSWDLHIGHTILAGIYFNDIRFRNETIVYELALQAPC